MVSGAGWEDHGELEKILSVWSPGYTDEFLSRPEGIGFSVHYSMPSRGNPIGRLHVDLQPAYRVADGKPLYVLNLTARGAPLSSGIDGAMHIFDVGHESI